MCTDSSVHLQAFTVALFPPSNQHHNFFPVPDTRVCHSYLSTTKLQQQELHPWAGKRQRTQQCRSPQTMANQALPLPRPGSPLAGLSPP